MPKCDACSKEITQAEMLVVDGSAVVARTSAGFVPSKAGGGLGSIVGQMGLSKADLWKSSVEQNATAEWAFCGDCHAELIGHGRALEQEDDFLEEYGIPDRKDDERLIRIGAFLGGAACAGFSAWVWSSAETGTISGGEAALLFGALFSAFFAVALFVRAFGGQG